MHQRLFIALNLSQAAKDTLSAVQETIKANARKGNFTLHENLHLTLAFLGDCDARQTAAAKSAMDSVSFEPFEMTIEGIGRFTRADGDIWWAGIKESEALADLYRQLTKALRSEGFKLDRHKFTPHITLARKVKSLSPPPKMPPFIEKAHKIHLMKSERIQGVLTYTSIHMRGKKLKPITVSPYNQDWPAQFERIKAFLLPHIGDIAINIHHVGSTSVPGLSAKPIIDFNIEIASMTDFPAIKKRLEALGYRHQGDYGITGREVFKPTRPDDFMEYHMYVCPTDSHEFKMHLKFRDYLRANPAAAKEYGQLKTENAIKFGNDIDAYIDGKDGFVKGVLGSFAT